jgi:hypothetical protein
VPDQYRLPHFDRGESPALPSAHASRSSLRPSGLNGVYAQRFNRRHGRRGHLFGDRFWASVVEDDHDVRAARYILLNPVRAGLCELPEEWRWSWSRYGKVV